MQLRHTVTDRVSGALLLALLVAGPLANSSVSASPSYRKANLSSMPAEAQAALKKYILPAPSPTLNVGDHPRVQLMTSKGPITVELNTKAAPLHVRSFVYLVKKGFYDGTHFHRFADLTNAGGNIIQGGDPLSKQAATMELAGAGGPGYEVPLEISSLKHDALVIAMARSNDPDSAGSQFYITQAPVHFLDGKYTVFGRVVAGPQAALSLRQGDTLEKATVVGGKAVAAKKPAAKAAAKPAGKMSDKMHRARKS